MLAHNHQHNIDRARKARSVHDLVRLTNDISKSIAKCSQTVNKLTRSSSRMTINTRPKKGFRVIISLSAKAPDDSSTETISIRHAAVQPGEKPKTVHGVIGKGFKPANLKAAEPHVAVIDELHEKLVELDSIEALLQQAFQGAKGQAAALKAVRTLKQEIDDTYHKAFTTIQKIGEENLPAELRELGEKAKKFLEANLEEGSYLKDGIDDFSYVSKTKEGLTNYTYYISIDDLKNSSGYVFHTYYVVISALIDKQRKVNYFLTTLADFRVPGSYPVGSPIATPADLEKKLDIMMWHNDVISVMDKKPLHIDKKSAQTRGFNVIPGVSGVDVRNDTLILKLANKKPKPQDIADVVKEVFPLLRPLLGNKVRSSDITWKKVAKVGYPVALHFNLIKAVGKGHHAKVRVGSSVNVDKLKDLQEALELTDEETDAVKKALLGIHK